MCIRDSFSPEDLDLVRGEPSDRRNFLDKLLITQSPRLAGVISDYDRVVRQRNTLLKTRAPQSALEPWTEQLIRFGAELSAERVKLVDDLNPYVAEHYRNLNEVKPASISYKSSTEGLTADVATNTEILTVRAAEVVKQEMDRGASLIGPHRDDLHLQLGDFPAKGYASHGESWSIALSLRLASFQLLQSTGAEPILILDDVFSELDQARREKLVQLANEAEQTLITVAVESDLPQSIIGEKYRVKNGVVKHE